MAVRSVTNPHPWVPEYSRTTPLVRTMGRNGAVASHHYLASEAGLEVLRLGGNAVDAAVAVSAALGVVLPAMIGPGGVGYMTIYSAADDRSYCVDFSGTAPAAAGSATFEDVYFGARAQLVPAAVAGWMSALERFGALDAQRVFAPAIRLAEDGFPVSPTLTYFVTRALTQLQGASSPVARLFAPNGRAPSPGEVLRLPDLAQTYRTIARDGAQAFYRGDLAERISAYIASRGGWLSSTDLAATRVEWQEPLSIEYRGWTVVTPPPPCSGIQTLETLKVLEGFDLTGRDPYAPDHVHTFVEAIKLARHDRVFGGSSTTRAASANAFLTEAHAAGLRGRIDPRRAAPSEGDWYSSPHTTHFATGDRAGNLVSSTQTIGAIFGSGEIVDGTGVLLNGMLFLFDRDPASPNRLEPGKKIDNPMSPVIARHSDGRVIAIGSPGGQGILQTTAQMLVDIVDYGLSPQAAVEAPRFVSFGRRAFIAQFGPDHDPTSLAIEDRFPAATLTELAARGHTIEPVGDWSHSVGAGAVVMRHANGVLEAGADPRQDGLAYAY